MKALPILTRWTWAGILLMACFPLLILMPHTSGAMDHLLSKKKLSKGIFLVAGRGLKDPNFSETVVLLTDYDQRGAKGLVINKPANVELSRLFPEIKALSGREDVLYIGGPVAINQLHLLLQSGIRPEDSQTVIEDIYISSNPVLFRRFLEGARPEQKFRVFAGYAGWGPGQLDREVSAGGWHILSVDKRTIFDKMPSEIWPELIMRSTGQWARLGRGISRR